MDENKTCVNLHEQVIYLSIFNIKKVCVSLITKKMCARMINLMENIVGLT
jgi:hypothetical protein